MPIGRTNIARGFNAKPARTGLRRGMSVADGGAE
jgi:hypothetical protein